MKKRDFDVGRRLRQVRVGTGLTQRKLAERAKVPHGHISMIEGNHSSPSVASLRKILSGIPMTMAEFFQPDAAPNQADTVVFRNADLADLSSKLMRTGGASSRGRLSLRQVGDARRHNLQILHEVYAPGADTGETMLEHESSEGGIVLSGEIELTVGDEVHRLRAGDSFIFDSRRPHRFRNVTRSPATVISACTPPYL
jgi:mannose-6-phosphate isomerase-like protein (cupin superfamily)